MSSAKAVQTEAIKTIIADFINPFAFKYRASKNMSQAASTKTNAIIQPAFIPATSFVWPHTSMIVRKSHRVSHSIVIRAFCLTKQVEAQFL